MNVPRALWVGAWIALLVLLHYSVRPFLAWRVQPDFLVIAVLLLAVRSRPAVAAFAGFLLGMVTDSLVPDGFGAGALAMTLVGFTASWLKATFFTDNLVLNVAFVFLGKWMYDIVYTLAEHKTRGIDLVTTFLWWSPLAAIVTAVVGLAVLALSRPPEMERRR